MKIVIPGGSGQVGTVLARAFRADGHEVTILSRYANPKDPNTIPWDAKTLGEWANAIDGADCVINLAGRSVNCRYHARNRRLIKESRIESTRILGEAIQQVARPPKVWLQSSTATIYAHRFDAPNDERTGILGTTTDDVPDTWRFSHDVALSWEAEALKADCPSTRLVLMRSAMIMSPDPGGVFDVLLWLVRFGLGGKNGHGKQFVSWIHDRDFIRALYWLIEHEDIRGPVNLASPNPVPNAEFMRTLRTAWGKRFGLPAANWMLEFGAFFLRTETELILKSRRVIPGLLLEKGFQFEFPTWELAAKDLCIRWRESKSPERDEQPI